LDVTVDRFDGGLYEEGDPLAVRVTCERSGFLYLLYLDSHGNPSLLYPQPGQDNRVTADEEVLIPGPEDAYVIPVSPPFGTARIKAVVCSQPLALSGLLPASQQQVQRPAGGIEDAQPTEGQLRQAEGGTGQTAQVARMQGFRWHPTQRRLIRRLLLRYQQEKDLEAIDYAQIDPQEILGPFAQDEVAFYIGPKKGE
jgi:hypothetical protein